jgi:multiple sugar transport system permease protein
MTSRRVRNSLAAIFFLTPNILGFLIFTVFPLVLTAALAFTSFDLRYQNAFHHLPLHFVGFGNFVELFNSPEFWRYFGNTLFFMAGIPLSIGGSLLLALMLSRKSWTRRNFSARALRYCSVAVGVLLMAAVFGIHSSPLTILLATVAGIILLAGVFAGATIYRTFLYLPSFTSGVAIFILWKKLYNPEEGPINDALRPVLGGLAELARAIPRPVFLVVGYLCTGITLLIALRFLRWLRRSYRSGEIAVVALYFTAALVIGAMMLGAIVFGGVPIGGIRAIAAGALLLILYVVWAQAKKVSHLGYANESSGFVLIGACVAIGCFAILGIAKVLFILPALGGRNLAAPQWLTDYYWAKPALMIIAFWVAIGSNNMLLYLAGIDNIPPELYEAADVDGASGLGRFWNVTWPQLAPTTFFILVMSVIGGLQGGFEMAKSMTEGGPAGSTTTLSYFIYSQGFETGRMGYASAISWTLFLLTIIIMALGWRFGSRYVND